MTNDTSTLNGALQELGETMAANLVTMGVTDASANDGLTTLAGKILDIPVTPAGPTLTLTADKSILSYADSESAVLTATYSDGAGETIQLYDGNDVLLGTMTDQNDGTYTYTYASAGAGDLTFKAKLGSLVSETYSIEDCYAYVTSTSNWTSHTNKGTSYLFSPFVLPTNHRIEFKLKSTNAVRVACGDTTHTNSGGWLEWIYAWYVDNKYLYYRNSNNGEASTKSSYTNDTTSTYVIEYSGTSLKLFKGDTQLESVTSYDTLTLTRHIRLNANSGTVANNLDWIKVKPL